LDAGEFEVVVGEVLDDLPDDFAQKLDNVEVEVQRAPSRAELDQQGIREGTTLLGLYRGVPRITRGFGYQLVMPDKITIYRDPILTYCRRTGEPEVEVIKRVVLHEIAHHFGIPDTRLRELGY
jgi:predicted Zn-dependent protease with MMP-like domain